MMDQIKKQKKLEEYGFPHLGKMIEKKVRQKRLTNSEMARRLGVSPTSFAEYLKQNSLQFRILWKIGLVLEYNFLADLMEYLPEDALNSSQSSFLETIQQQAEEIKDLKKENEIYKGILKR